MLKIVFVQKLFYWLYDRQSQVLLNQSYLPEYRTCLIYRVTDIRFRSMVFKATFNNILVISWRLVLLVEVTGVP